MRKLLGKVPYALVLLPCVLASGCLGVTEARLEGAGSSFVDAMMQKWSSIYYRQTRVGVNYQPKGSGAGISMMTSGDADFGCSDAPLNDEQIDKCRQVGGEVLHIPLCMGAIVPAYNLPGAPELVFSGGVLLDIYRGRITRWDDPAIRELNPTAELPHLAISVAFRSDSSGSTYILTDYFTKVNKAAWKAGRGTAVNFPVGIGAKGNAGVAGFVKDTEGAIGYVELIYAVNNDIAFGAVINAAGKPVKADLASVTAAAATAEIPDDLRYSITNAKGEKAYPIAGTVWALVYAKQPKEKAEAVKKFLSWITHEGQKHADKLHYAPLPANLVKKVEKKLDLIE